MLYDAKLYKALEGDISSAYEYSYSMATDPNWMIDARKEYISACMQYHDAKELLKHLESVISETADSMEYIGSKLGTAERLEIFRKYAK